MVTSPPRRPAKPANASVGAPHDGDHREPAPTEAAGPGGPLSEAEMAQLQALMDSLPDTLEPLDVVMIDGFLCGVLLQPQPVPIERWLPLIPDVDGRAPPKRFDLATLHALVLRRHAELDAAIARRQWFDPWIYQLDDEATLSETVLPWVAGFATAVDAFTTLMDRHEDELLEPLATLYRHLDPDDLEDADELLAEIETLALPETLVEAVEDLVRSVLLMADVSRPQTRAKPAPLHPALARRLAPGAALAGQRPVAKKVAGRGPAGAGGRGPAGRPRGGR